MVQHQQIHVKVKVSALKRQVVKNLNVHQLLKQDLKEDLEEDLEEDIIDDLELLVDRYKKK